MPPRAARPGDAILDKLYEVIFLYYFEQLLLGYIAYMLIVNHLTVLPGLNIMATSLNIMASEEMHIA